MKITKEQKAEFSKLSNDDIDELIVLAYEKDNYDKIESILKYKVDSEPDDHYWLARYGSVLYEQRKYKEAENILHIALEIEPECPLIIEFLGLVYLMLDKFKESIEIWNYFLDLDIYDLAYGECGDGLRVANTTVNDSRARLGICYEELGMYSKAAKYYSEHLTHRKRGQFSNFSKKRIIMKLDEVKSKTN